MPLIGLLLGGISFTNLKFKIGDAVIAYGIFIQTIVDFIIVAFSIFLFVKLFNRLKRKEEDVPPEPPVATKEEQLLTEIRDLLKSNNR